MSYKEHIEQVTIEHGDISPMHQDHKDKTNTKLDPESWHTYDEDLPSFWDSNSVAKKSLNKIHVR